MGLKLNFLSLLVATITILLASCSDSRYYENAEYRWRVELGAPGGDFLVRGRKVDRIKHDINKLIFVLNKSDKDPETFRTPPDREPTDPPKLKLRGIKDNVVSVEVINDEHLTQRMGTTGAEVFLVTATYTLTEHDNITAVNFIFEQGDHAEPGIYTRDNFRTGWKAR